MNEAEKATTEVLFTLEEYQQLDKVPSGRVAGIKVWKKATLEPKTRNNWKKEFERFTKRTIK